MPLSHGNEDSLTVLVFKDDLSSRTFKIPLSWFRRFGLLSGLLICIAISTSLFAYRYYRLSSKGDPARVHELEKELEQSKASYQSLTASAPKPPAENATAHATIPLVLAPPTQTACPVCPTSAPVAAAVCPPAPACPACANNTTSAPSAGGAVALFSALPGNVKTITSAEPPVAITQVKITWQRNDLSVHFGLEYVKKDNGNQQGRIFLLARGSDVLAAYPSGALNLMNANTLISPEKGEYFSVSHFREVNAKFGPFKNHEAVKEVEAIILDNSGDILVHQKLSLSGETASAAQSPPKTPASPGVATPSTAAPKPDVTTPVEPGYDR
jgi:hypothetical protein